MRQKHKFWDENCKEVLYEIKNIYFQLEIDAGPSSRAV